MLLLLWSPTDARKRLEEDVGHRKGQAGALAPPFPQDSDRTRPQQPCFLSFVVVMHDFIGYKKVKRLAGNGTSQCPGFLGYFGYIR